MAQRFTKTKSKFLKCYINIFFVEQVFDIVDFEKQIKIYILDLILLSLL